MKKLWFLLIVRFKNAFNIDKIKNVKKGKLLLYSLITIYVLFSLFTVFYGYANDAITFLNNYQLITYAIVLFVIGAMISTFMFTIYNAKNSMFSSNDNDLLMAMPIKASTILASRLIYITIWNLLVNALIMIPVFIVYATKVNVPLVYYIYAVIVFLLTPVLPTIIASILGYIIAYFTSKSNAKNLFEIVMSFTMMGLLYYGMAKMDAILNYLATNINNFENVIKWVFYPIFLVSEIFNDYNIISLLLFVIINISLFVIFTYILSINFKNIIARLQSRAKSNYVMKNLKTNKVSKALFVKELKRFLSSPIYVLNTTIGLVMFIVGSIATISYDIDEIIIALGFTTTSNTFNILIPAAIFIAFLSNTTSSSVSLEGKNFWILKTLPIEPFKVLWAKVCLNIALIFIFTFIGSIILSFTLGLTYIELLLILLFTIVSSLAASEFGLLINLRFPKMDALNDTVVVKRSLSVMITVFVPLIIFIAITGLYPLISNVISFTLLLGIIFALLIVIAFIEYYLLKTWGVRRFKEIN